MKLDVNVLRYLSREDFRVLTAVEMGQKNVRAGQLNTITSAWQRYDSQTAPEACCSGLGYIGILRRTRFQPPLLLCSALAALALHCLLLMTTLLAACLCAAARDCSSNPGGQHSRPKVSAVPELIGLGRGVLYGRSS